MPPTKNHPSSFPSQPRMLVIDIKAAAAEAAAAVAAQTIPAPALHESETRADAKPTTRPSDIDVDVAELASPAIVPTEIVVIERDPTRDAEPRSSRTPREPGNEPRPEPEDSSQPRVEPPSQPASDAFAAAAAGPASDPEPDPFSAQVIAPTERSGKAFPSTSEAPPAPVRSSRSWTTMLFVLALGAAGGYGVAVFRGSVEPPSWMAPHLVRVGLKRAALPPAAASSSTVSKSEVPEAPPAESASPQLPESPAGSPSASASTASGAKTGLLKTTGLAPGRRIFIDDLTMGQTPDSVSVPCGSHRLKLGSMGVPRTVEIPCGGEIAVSEH
jgi:hypothetical protein